MQQQPQLRVGPKSHPGKVRSENQDRMSRFVSPFGEVFIVADGMGGHQGGATAALMTIEGFASHLSATPRDAAVETALQDAATKTNDQIFREAGSGDPATAKMGSTVVLALVSGAQIRVAHAGDSRAYLFRNGQLRRLTKDHSAVQRMIDHNMLTEAEARDHPDASVILRAFGQKPEIELEVSAPFTLQAGDGLLLCTDGLCGYVDDAEIARAIGDDEDPQQIADALVELALNAGGEDNVTVQFLQFGQRPRAVRGAPLESQSMPAPAARPPTVAAPRWWQSAYVMIGLLGIIGFLFGWLLARPIYSWGQRLFAPAPSPSPSASEPAQPRQQPPAPANSAPNTAPTVSPSAQPAGGSIEGVLPTLPSPSPVATKPPGGGKDGGAGTGSTRNQHPSGSPARSPAYKPPSSQDASNAARKIKDKARQEIDEAKKKLEEKKKE